MVKRTDLRMGNHYACSNRQCLKEHLRAMDDLKQSVSTAYLEQKDPLVI